MLIQLKQKESEQVYLFISHSMEIGGIESLLVRMSNGLAELGLPVHVICPDGPMCSSLDISIQQHKYDHENNLDQVLRSIRLEGYRTAKIWISLPHWIIRTHWFLDHIWKTSNVRSEVVSGIFHPNQIRKTSKASILYWKTLALRKILPNGSIYFMNDSCKAAHGMRWGRLFERWPVHRIELPEDKLQAKWKASIRTKLNIVSIGRITRFKGYNYVALKVVQELEEAGVSSQWDIFGDGDDLQELMEESCSADGERKVRYLGSVPYERFSSTVTSYDVFVGMGTAALEAAKTGIPTVLSIESQDRYCYGFLSQAPSDSIGEVVPGIEKKDLFDVLKEFSELSLSKRVELGDACALSVGSRVGNVSAPYENIFSTALHHPPSRRSISRALLKFSSLLLRANRT